MTNLAVTNELFFDRTGLDPHRVETIVGEALAGMDDGERRIATPLGLSDTRYPLRPK